MMIKPATNSGKTGHRPTNCNGSKSKSTKAKVWSSGASYSPTSNTDLTNLVDRGILSSSL